MATYGEDLQATVQVTRPVQQWRAARAQLASAIQAFSEASASLDPSEFVATSSTSPHPGQVDRSLNKLDIDRELWELSAQTKRLDDACTWLKVKRNRSQEVVSINRLSEDILTRIFATVIAWDDLSCDFILSTTKSRKTSRSGIILSSVSAAWRYIVVNTSSFWTHLDVSVSETSYYVSKRTELYLERVKDAPVDLHILSMMFGVNEADYTAPAIPESLINRRVASLTIESFSQVHVTALAEAWLDNDGTHDLRSLRVSVNSAPYMYHRAQSIGASGLHHISALRVSGIGMNWGTLTLSQFTDLDLSDLESGSCPSIEQLQTILMSNPELRILRLSNVSIYAPLESYAAAAATSIRLPKLQFLGIGRLPWHSMALLMKVLAPGPEFSCLSFSCAGFGEEALELLEAFCEPHKITTLSLDMPIYHEQNLAIFLRSFKNLHTLNLSHLDLHTHAFPDILSDRSMGINSNPAPDFPRIRRLRFYQCRILASALKSIVVTHPISWLRVDSCGVFEGFSNPSLFWDHPSASNLPDSLTEWLSSVVQEFQVNSTYDVVSQGLPWWLLPV